MGRTAFVSVRMYHPLQADEPRVVWIVFETRRQASFRQIDISSHQRRLRVKPKGLVITWALSNPRLPCGFCARKVPAPEVQNLWMLGVSSLYFFVRYPCSFRYANKSRTSDCEPGHCSVVPPAPVPMQLLRRRAGNSW